LKAVSAFLPDETRISQVHLRTRNLERAVGFYTGTLGLRSVERTGRKVALSPTENAPAMIVLSEASKAKPRPARATGLYHLAIRYPTRRDLAHAVHRLMRVEYPIQGASDHQVSEAIYLTDPDENGVELYADRPRSQWAWRDGQVAMTTEPLDIDNLLASTKGQLAPFNVPPQADLGHIHLHVADLLAAERFYHEFLGLAVTQRSYPGALFFSVGGYHHHLAVNTWAGNQPPPANSLGLIGYRLEVPEAEILYCLRNRAPLAGYETRTKPGANSSELLQIRDPNGHWLEMHSVSSPRPTPTEQECSQPSSTQTIHSNQT
jgi:catechol 2,3-dioxygenase